MERERLQNVLSELIELQWTCTCGQKYDVYENMIKQVGSLLKKNHQENNPVHKPLSH